MLLTSLLWNLRQPFIPLASLSPPSFWDSRPQFWQFYCKDNGGTSSSSNPMVHIVTSRFLSNVAKAALSSRFYPIDPSLSSPKGLPTEGLVPNKIFDVVSLLPSVNLSLINCRDKAHALGHGLGCILG